MKPTFGSAFAGIGGFELGLERAGWECKWQIENDKFCNKILKKVWPDVKRYEDIEEVNSEELEPVDLVCGGFPCQDLSVAGKRGGLSGERSGLFWELVRMARELEPRWLLIENVPGFLSSNEGEDFALAIETLAECGYGLAWRVLDSQYFGVPQRRRRVFIVGHLGAMCPPEILFESEGGEGDIAESGKAGEDIAYSLGGRIKKGGEPWRHEKGRETLISFDAYNQQEIGDKTGILREQHGTNANIIARPVDPVPGRGVERGRDTLIIEENTRDELRIRQSPPTVSARPGGQQKPWIVQDLDGLGHREDEDTWGGGESPDLGDERREGRSEDSPHRLYHNKGQDFDLREYEGISPAVTERWGTGGGNVPYVGEEADPNGVREASGVPRRVDYPDSPRYRALGNAVTVQVAEWIGRRILECGVR